MLERVRGVQVALGRPATVHADGEHACVLARAVVVDRPRRLAFRHLPGMLQASLVGCSSIGLRQDPICFDDFLKEDGIYEGVTARAIKRVLARQLSELMRREEISKTELASRMKTSRAQLDRLLDPENESVTLGTLAKAAQAVGRHLRMELV